VAMKTQAGVYWDKEKTKPIDPRAALRWRYATQRGHRHPRLHNVRSAAGRSGGAARARASRPRHPRSCATRSSRASSARAAEKCPGALPRAPAHPELMRSYMYGHAYRNREARAVALARARLAPLAVRRLRHLPCGGAKGFDVARAQSRYRAPARRAAGVPHSDDGARAAPFWPRRPGGRGQAAPRCRRMDNWRRRRRGTRPRRS